MAVTVGDVILDELVSWLRPRLLPLIVGKPIETMPTGDKIILTTFEELREITVRVPAFPDGLDFTSREGSHRSSLYEHRVDLAEEDCWFAPDYGVGLKWTADPILGIRWFDEMQMDKAKNRAGTALQLWEIAEEHAPHRLKAILGFLRRDAARFKDMLEDTGRYHERTFERVSRGEIEPPED